jgi:hypothetical protein
VMPSEICRRVFQAVYARRIVTIRTRTQIDARSPCRVDLSNEDKSVLRIRARPGQRWHINRALYSRASRLLWRRIACAPLRGQTCEHEESDCVRCFQRAPKEKGRRNGQESGIVVRGGRVALWWGVEALIGESASELIEW